MMRALTAAVLCSALIPLPLGAAQAAERCNRIADAAARLACYDARNGAPAAPRGAVPGPAPVTMLPSPSRRSIERVRPAERAAPELDSRIVAVRPALHGYWLLTLADGRLYETTQSGDAPTVGEAVHLRRTFLGTTFLDIHGRTPLTVRPVPRPD
jgi:hypothetical protein